MISGRHLASSGGPDPNVGPACHNAADSATFRCYENGSTISGRQDFRGVKSCSRASSAPDGRYAYLDLRKDLKTIVEIEEIDVPYQDALEAAKALLAGDQAEDLAGSRLADQPAR